jgi:hypothetical protein
LAQAGRFKVRPGLLRAVAADRMEVETVCLRERLRHAGFDLRRKSGQNGKSSGGKRSHSDG